MQSLQGSLLVAAPALGDVNFFRSVVLMLRHDEDGALGLVLNRPTNDTVATVWQAVGLPPVDGSRHIYLGGPVSGPLMAVHTSKFLAQGEVFPGLFFTSAKEALTKLASAAVKRYRIFSGYSGWGAGQLEEELAAGGWLLTPATIDDVFHDGDDLWHKVVRRIGREILGAEVAKRPAPEDPMLN